MSKKYSLYSLLTGLLIAILALSAAAAAPASNAAKPATATPSGPTPTPAAGTAISVYGAWHCGNHYCDWSTVRNTAPGGEFDVANHWIIDRGDGKPSANIVILSFVEPLKLLNQTTDSANLNGIPRGMDLNVVNYFKSKGIRVMISIGGITYVTPWDNALNQNATLLGQRAAALATQLGVGIEIDWEENSPTTAELSEIQAFVSAYRAVHPYDATGNDPTARFTIDLAVGNRWLIDLSTQAARDWLQTETPVLDYFNAMVPGTGQPSTAQWQEHIDGYLFGIPEAPAKMTGSLWLVKNSGTTPLPECNNYANSTQKAYATYVQTVQPNGEGTTAGMLGYMFWAAECQGTHSLCTVPPNTCEAGMGEGAKQLNVPIPMPALRQK
jgi:hypothetical protein